MGNVWAFSEKKSPFSLARKLRKCERVMSHQISYRKSIPFHSWNCERNYFKSINPVSFMERRFAGIEFIRIKY